MTRTRAWLWAAAATLAAASGCRGAAADRAHLPAAPAAGPAKASAGSPRAQGAARRPKGAAAHGAGLLLTGTLKASRISVISPRVGGTVARVHVKEGHRVKGGQPLVSLDATDFALGLRAAEAARATARAQVGALEVQWRRLAALLKAKAVPRSDYDRLDGQLAVARAALAQADVGVAQARRALANAVVRAPYAAVVTRVMIHEGEYAAMMPPARLVVLEDADPVEAWLQVPESAVADVRAGTRLALRFGAAGPRRTAAVARVVPSLDPRTRSFTAIVALPNPRGALRPGMFVEARLAAPPPAR